MVEVREIAGGELDRWLVVASRVKDQGSAEAQLDWRRQADDLTWFLASQDGEDVGAAVALVGWHSPPGVGFGEAFVPEDGRAHGVGSALFEMLARWVAERGFIELESVVRDGDEPSIAWARRRGFREVGRSSRLVLDLAGLAEPAVDPPDGIEIVSWADRPELAGGLYEVYCEASPDIPGEGDEEVPPFERWLSMDMQGASDSPEYVFVALAGDEVVGYAKLSILGPGGTAYHDLTGVKRSWRGRGIAGALKRAEIAWAVRERYDRLETHNEERNEPIRKLNERHGYRIEPGEIRVRALLSGPD